MVFVPGVVDSLICEATRALGHVMVTGVVLPARNLNTVPSISRFISFMPSSISTARMSTLNDGVLPPLRKNTSLIRAARWKSTRAAALTGFEPSPTGLKLHGLVPVSTSGASLVL